MKYLAVRTVGPYRQGHEYEIRKLRVTDRMAIRAGYLVAASGWCAPSEVLPELSAAAEAAPKPAKKAVRPRKKAVAPDTLESLAESTSEALDGLRGQ